MKSPVGSVVLKNWGIAILSLQKRFFYQSVKFRNVRFYSSSSVKSICWGRSSQNFNLTFWILKDISQPRIWIEISRCKFMFGLWILSEFIKKFHSHRFIICMVDSVKLQSRKDEHSSSRTSHWLRSLLLIYDVGKIKIMRICNVLGIFHVKLRMRFSRPIEEIICGKVSSFHNLSSSAKSVNFQKLGQSVFPFVFLLSWIRKVRKRL